MVKFDEGRECKLVSCTLGSENCNREMWPGIDGVYGRDTKIWAGENVAQDAPRPGFDP